MPRTKQFSEEETLEKALNLFWRDGYHATSIQKVVSELGINRASLYDTYGGKKELFNKAFETYRNSFIVGLKKFLESQDSVKTAFKTLFEKASVQALKTQAGKGCFVVNTTVELAHSDPEVESELRKNRETLVTIFKEFIQTGIENGELRNDLNAQLTADTIFTFYNGMMVISKLNPKPDALKNQIALMLSMLN